MPIPEKKIFTELLDADTAPHLVGAQSFINGMNLRFGTTDDGYTGFFEGIKGNTEIDVTLPAGTNICIGACTDDTNQYAIFFNHNSNGDHGIYLYDVLNDTFYVVLESDDTDTGLNFDKYHLINGAHVINGILYWNDNYNEPRKLNLATFMDAQGSNPLTEEYAVTFPVAVTELTVIQKPCPIPPYITKAYDGVFGNNFIKNNSYLFAIEYTYYDGERSVLSPWSKASLINLATETFNYITVEHPLFQVPQMVRLVRIIVKDALTEEAWVIKTWDREHAGDNDSINANLLSFNFYNNISGEFIDDVTKITPFHAVPELAGTQAPAKNRMNYGDITKGKDTPTLTSLTAEATSFTVSLSNITLPLLKVGHRRAGISGDSDINGYYFIAYMVYIPGGNGIPEGYYYITSTALTTTTASSLPSFPTMPSPPASPLALSSFTFAGLTMSNVIANTLPSGAGVWSGSTTYQLNQTVGSTMQVTGLSTSSYRVFKSNSQYNLGVVFYDRYLRKSGVVFNDTEVVIPERSYAYSTGYGNIIWELSNTAALTEIPDWAHYFSIVMTKNLRTRNFVSAYAGNTCKYATKDSNGLFVYTETSFTNAVVAVAIDTKGLLQANLGYSFTENDQCVIIDNAGTKYELPVIGQDGQYILIAPKDLGTLSSKTFVYEIYTPHKQSDQEPFFEVGEMNPIEEPGTSSRVYGVTAGSIRADSVVLSRNYDSSTYFAEAMSPNDVYWQRWFTDAGRANFQTKLGRVRKKTGICFSNVWIPGTQTNGLSTFDVLDEEILPETMGAIKKLVLANKVQQQGTVLLAIGENETASIYLGEVQVFDQAQQSFLAKASGYIGQVNILQGSYGTQNPESVAELNGYVYWADVKSRVVVRYGSNGLFPISDYGIKRAFNLFCKQYETMSTGDIETLGSRPFLFGGIDEYHQEYILSIPRTTQDPPKWYLDYLVPGTFTERLYLIQHASSIVDANNPSSTLFRGYSAYAVFIDTIAPAGWYIVLSSEVISGITNPVEYGLPPLPTASDFTGLQYAGATEADMNFFISQKPLPSVNYTSTPYSFLVTDSGSDIDIDPTGYEVPFPYDIYDGRAKVLVYKINRDKWGAPHGYEPEMFVCTGVVLFSWKNGVPWLHNSNILHNSFYGVRSKAKVMFVARGDEDPSKIKTWQSISVESNFKPSFVHLRTDTPNIQSSDLDTSDFVTREGIYYAPILRDRLSPNVTGTALEKLKKGDKMRGPYIYVMLEWDTEALLQFKFVNVGHNITAGHPAV